MKNKEEIRREAEEMFWKRNGRDFEEHEITQIEKGEYIGGYLGGYTQCQEDMYKKYMADKKYTEEDLLHAFREGVLLPNSQIGIMEDIFKQVVHSLNKQD